MLISTVGLLDTELRDHEHGKRKPEGAVGAVDSCTKSVAHTEFHDAGNELCGAAVEDSQTEYCLVRTDASKGVGVWQSGEDELLGPSCETQLSIWTQFDLPSTALV